ncbi:MAG: hypothetical protein U1E10_09210 [Bdellovibrionales bacterium]|nr:hypothetical protein [Bdellovibrionales bacterium]
MKMRTLRPVILFSCKVLSLGLLVSSGVGCGVKGKPLPPLEPAQIGRGAPTYKRTAEQARPTGLVVPTPTPDGRGR